MIYLVFLLSFMVTLWALQLKVKNDKAKCHPPGLPEPSIITFVKILMAPHVGKEMARMGKNHGDILYLSLGFLKAVIINGSDKIKAACLQPSLNGRGPCLYKEVIGEKGIIWSDDVIHKRKLIFRNTRHFALGGKSAEGKVHEEISTLFKSFDRLKGKPMLIKNAFTIATFNGVTNQISGEKFPHDDPRLQSTIRSLNRMMEVPNTFGRLCFILPWLTKWIPESLNVKNLYKKTVRDGLEIFHPCVDKHRRTQIPNEPRDLVDAILDEVENKGAKDSSLKVSQESVAPILFDLVTAAIETTGAAMEWMVLYLTQFPQVQRKLQLEVNDVIGPERLPEISDRNSMPYIQAFMHEVFRMAPPTPVGYHMALEDTFFKGFFIEKGTYVISNFYGAHMDKRLWEEPEQFRPERFMDGNGHFLKSEYNFVFGFGKRSCIGEVTARDQIFLFLSRMMQEYNIVAEKKLHSLDGSIFVTNHAPEFRARFLPRY